MTPTHVKPPPVPKPKAVVKGPIRCHKCQMLCKDAEQYLSHVCASPVGPQL